MPEARRFLALLLAVVLSACATHFPARGDAVTLASHTVFFPGDFAHLSQTPDTRITARLILPKAPFAAPFPAMVLLHTAAGRNVHEWRYAQLLLDNGIAVLAPDSFKARGVASTSKAEWKVTEASILVDAYAGLHYLSQRPDIRPGRIGVMGSSKGGAPAIFSALASIRAQLAHGSERFAVHVAFYPWCAVAFRDMRTTGAPVMIQMGADDTVTPAAACTDLKAQLRAADPKADIRLTLYPHTAHGFDHPYAGNLIYNTFHVDFGVPTLCRFRETDPGVFVESYAGKVVTPQNYADLLRNCSTTGARIVGDTRLRTLSHERVIALLRETLLGSGN